jgi:GNAT superfamily N-acetyltransferase
MADRELPGIVRLDETEKETAAALIAEAFVDLPAARWLVPDPGQRVEILGRDFTILVGHALRHGHVDLLDDRSGVAVWFDRTRPVPPPDDYPRRLRAACGDHHERFEHLDDLFDAHHPAARHHHLALLAVAPGRQGVGRGSALLAHHHRHLDRAGLPAYLEASSESSRDLYLRHGYRVGAPFTLPDGSPFWPMWREPR